MISQSDVWHVVNDNTLILVTAILMASSLSLCFCVNCMSGGRRWHPESRQHDPWCRSRRGDRPRQGRQIGITLISDMYDDVMMVCMIMYHDVPKCKDRLD